MTIERIIIKNYRTLYDTEISLGSGINIIVGDNETGKSTLLEAINLALKCQLNRRPASYELHPFLFNSKTVSDFIEAHKAGRPCQPPEILIELYLKNDPLLADIKGTINSEQIDQPGISLHIRLDENFKDQYKEYVSDPTNLHSIPIEFYEIVWLSFSGNELSLRSLPIRPVLIDPSSISNSFGVNKYVLEIIRDYLSDTQAVNLALSYRKMRSEFLGDEKIQAINRDLASKKSSVSDKCLSIAMDVTAKAGWEAGVLPHLDDIPLTLVGKGEQNAIKIKLAMEAADKCQIMLIEEPENHLTHTNLNKLLSKIIEKAGERQLIVTTHSSFVLNKLGIENTLLFNGQSAVNLNSLPEDTEKYFKKLPGHDTLRMILAERTILVEGPSDELIVQKAFYQKHQKMPLEAGVEIICVNSLAFKRFLDIAVLLKMNVSVVADNDGKTDKKLEGYKDYNGVSAIKICLGVDDSFPSLEQQLLRANGRDKLNRILGVSYADDDAILKFMIDNKTETALRIFESSELFVVPEYIKNAVA